MSTFLPRSAWVVIPLEEPVMRTVWVQASVKSLFQPGTATTGRSCATPATTSWKPGPGAASPAVVCPCLLTHGGQGSVSLGWLHSGPILGSGKKMCIQTFPTSATQPFLTPASSGPSAKRFPHPIPPNLSQDHSWSLPLDSEWHSLPRHCFLDTHSNAICPSLLLWGLQSSQHWAKTVSNHWLPSSSSPLHSPALPCHPFPVFLWLAPLALLPEQVSFKSVLKPHVSPRPATHFSRLLSQPGTGSAWLSSPCSMSCGDAQIRAASDWLPLNTSHPGLTWSLTQSRGNWHVSQALPVVPGQLVQDPLGQDRAHASLPSTSSSRSVPPVIFSSVSGSLSGQSLPSLQGFGAQEVQSLLLPQGLAHGGVPTSSWMDEWQRRWEEKRMAFESLVSPSGTQRSKADALEAPHWKLVRRGTEASRWNSHLLRACRVWESF